MKPFKEVIDGIRKAVMASEVREDLAQMGEYVEQFANTAGENIQKAIDPTLSLSGKAADAKATGDVIQSVRDDLASEISRAKTAEKSNDDNIAAEAERAQAAENALSAKITEETERAKAAEQTNADGIAAEASRAKGEEQRLDTAITSETTRAEQAEQALGEQVSALDGSMQALGLTVSSGRLCVVYKKTAVAIAEGGAEV